MNDDFIVQLTKQATGYEVVAPIGIRVTNSYGLSQRDAQLIKALLGNLKIVMDGAEIPPAEMAAMLFEDIKQLLGHELF